MKKASIDDSEGATAKNVFIFDVKRSAEATPSMVVVDERIIELARAGYEMENVRRRESTEDMLQNVIGEGNYIEHE